MITTNFWNIRILRHDWQKDKYCASFANNLSCLSLLCLSEKKKTMAAHCANNRNINAEAQGRIRSAICKCYAPWAKCALGQMLPGPIRIWSVMLLYLVATSFLRTSRFPTSLPGFLCFFLHDWVSDLCDLSFRLEFPTRFTQVGDMGFRLVWRSWTLYIFF